MSMHLAQKMRASFRLATIALVFGVIFGISAQAHVRLNTPNGGEVLAAGSEFPIEWLIEVSHSTLGWDLWFSTESNAGPWDVIALGIASGDTSENAVHTFDWTIPNVADSSAWVRVRQDNAGMDYYDVSNASFGITAVLSGADFTGDGSVDGADLSTWQLGFGTQGAAPADGDADRDTDVDGADFLAWQSQYDGIRVMSSAQSIQLVPEPAATVLLLLGLIVLLLRRC